MRINPGGPRPRIALALLKLGGFILVLVLANYAFEHLKSLLDIDIRPSNENTMQRIIMVAAVLYTIALAIPFVPGVEIGVGMITVLGVDIVPLVYLCTVIGLASAFLAGRLFPASVLARLAYDLKLSRIALLITRFDDTPQKERLNFLLASAPKGPIGFLIRYRYVAIALALNVPGNFMIGGGGGIALLAGLSRLFSIPLFLLTLALAVSPVPLAILILGPSVLSP